MKKRAKNPRVLREALGLTLDEAGRRSGIERSRLWRYENGYIRIHDDERMRLADVLNAGRVAIPLLVSAPRNG